MMLTEIIHNPKNKIVISVLVIGIMVCIFYLLTKKHSIIAKQFISDKMIGNVQAEKQISVNFTFEIREDSVEYFYEPSEWGYHYAGYSDLFLFYWQPPYLGIEPPFLCASIQLKGADDFFDIIIDNNGKAIFEVGHVFFELNRVN